MRWTPERLRQFAAEKQRLDAVDPASWFDLAHRKRLVDFIRREFNEDVTLNAVNGVLTRIRDNPEICEVKPIPVLPPPPKSVEPPKPWLHYILFAFEKLDKGEGCSINEVLDVIEGIHPQLSGKETWRNTVRYEIQRHCSDSPLWHRNGGRQPDLFRHISRCLWGLRTSPAGKREPFDWSRDNFRIAADGFLRGDSADRIAETLGCSTNQVLQCVYNNPPKFPFPVNTSGPLSWSELWQIGGTLVQSDVEPRRGWKWKMLTRLGLPTNMRPPFSIDYAAPGDVASLRADYFRLTGNAIAEVAPASESVEPESVEPESVEAESVEVETSLDEAAIRQLLNEAAIREDAIMREMDRVRRQTDLDRKYAGAEPIKALLPILDNLVAMQKVVVHDSVSFDGVTAILAAGMSALETLGIQQIGSVGEPFDPNFHEAALTKPVPADRRNIIVEVLRPGYMLHERLLRPALVAVGAAAVQ